MSNLIPLLFIPGLLCDAALWQSQINHLKDIADCMVADTTRHDRIAALAQDVLMTAPPKFALAGLSMGGYVSLEIMRQAPERVLKLAIFDSTARADTPQQQERRRLLLSLSRHGQFKGVTPRLLPMLIHPARLDDAALTGLITQMAERVGRAAFIHQQTAILHRQDSRPFLGNITCPTLIAGGRQDAITGPELLQELADNIPGARFEIVENCGHLLPLEQPDSANLLLRQWLGA
jgi:pimeloyl-ACP methyl ester carboxylesterase